MGQQHFIVFRDKKYGLNLKEIKKFCFDGDSGRETEIVETYIMNDGEPTLDSKQSRDFKSNSQQDTMRYDLIKTLITVLLTNESIADGGEVDDNLDFASALAMNTLIEANILYEIND